MEYPQLVPVVLVPPKRGFSTWSIGKKIGLLSVILLALFVMGFIGYKIINYVAHPDLKLNGVPPGYEQLTGDKYEKAKEQFEEFEKGGSMDALYVAMEDKSIFLAHFASGEVRIITIGKGSDPPETHDLGEMERFIDENRDAIEEELEQMYEERMPEAETSVNEAVQLTGDGFCGIHIGAEATKGEIHYVQDRILFYRNNVTYLAAVQNYSGDDNTEEVEYLLQNLYFE